MQCCALHSSLEQPWCHPSVVSIAARCWHRIRTPSKAPGATRLRVGK